MSTPPAAVRVDAPAKVNLFLEILERRADGFHELDTLFQAVSLYDRVRVSVGDPGVRLRVEGADVGPTEDNLAYRAATAFLSVGGIEEGVDIHLVKGIPAGAGLGGGSSDAGAVLRCLDTLWPGRVAPPVIHEAAAALGSDVPFFLGKAALARGRGRGEVLESVRALPVRPLVLVLPPVHVATGGAYGALARRRSDAEGSGSALGRAPGLEADLSWDGVERRSFNDFEAVVPDEYPEVAASLDALREVGAASVLLSGSGGACFGLFAEDQQARLAAQGLRERLGWPAVAVSTLSGFPPVVED